MDQLPRLGKRELICLLLFTCIYVVSVWRGLLFLWLLRMGYVILFWHSLSLPLIILCDHSLQNNSIFLVHFLSVKASFSLSILGILGGFSSNFAYESLNWKRLV